MPKIVDHKTFRINLLESAITCVCRDGFEGVTTKSIAKESDLNESYIYRYFVDKDDLLYKAFLYLDEVLFNKLEELIVIATIDSMSAKEKYERFAKEVLNFYADDDRKTNYYYRFYYSAYMTADVYEMHTQIVSELSSRIINCFKDDVDSKFAIHHLFSTFSSMIRYYTNEADDQYDEIIKCLVETIDKYVDQEKIQYI